MINEKITRYVAQHEQVLHDLVSKSNIPANRIKEAILYSLFPGGKRLRPVLVYLCGEIVGVELGSLDIMAAAIEIIHCYSLVHDDLPAMDNDDFRRGKPSCHRAFDEATAILVGDGMQALAIDVLLSGLTRFNSAAQVIQITHELVKASGPSGMVSGQSLDLSELSNSTIQESELDCIHRLKTGKLISACFTMVLAASSCSASTAHALKQFADYLGLAFQMQDDYLDLYAEQAVLGKGRASDMANHKMTYASLYNQHDLYQLIAEHFKRARDCLTPLGEQANDLLVLCNYLQQRSHNNV
ncbi:polyprenyl synthetase family protein [Legionella jordanis]|nr:farnesyl diphosphate synthase [Legionella jordanis]RMX03680.1 polyprenyl synthetase family protein [Legionella jordanis]RMX22259.1 polyprenyl synthetase family protein [Legionella jordanis]HAT8712950.1 polyprenyl synthetase family protein [Legionella jordanis]